jgi:ParB family transcriptional regulator, chromosome partitioning protein
MIDEKQKPDTRKRGLGRGLDALFGDDEDRFSAVAAAEEGLNASISRKIAGIDQLQPGKFQPRHIMPPEELEELSNSIKIHGILQPILVRTIPGHPENYEIIAGERRWRAAQKAQLHEVPVIVRDLTDIQALEFALVENLQRTDLNVIDEATGYDRLLKEFGHTQEKIAEAMGKSRSHIANTLRLLTLPAGVQMLVQQGRLSAGHARALVTAKDPHELAKIVLSRNLSVRETEKLAAEEKGRKKTSKPGQPQAKDTNTLALEKEISNRLGMKVTLDVTGEGAKTAGTMKIEFRSLDQLDHLLKRLSQ